MWCHLPTGFRRRIVTTFVALIFVFAAFLTTLLFAYHAYAAEGINKTLNFQGRLLQATGAVVPDGYYNIQFKIYQGGSGAAANNPDGTLKWTESYVNNGGTSGVRVKNGLFSVDLGSVTPFGTSIDWNQDTIWLSMNVAGSSASCTSFGGAPCTADGEMLPMKRMTSVPYALNAGQLGGKTADNFLQLAQGVQQDVSNNSDSIAINKTGAGGNFITLQANGEDVLQVSNEGNIALGGQSDHQLSVSQAPAEENGKHLTIAGGRGGDSATGGTDGGFVVLRGGDGGGTGGNGGGVAIESGNGSGGGTGTIYMGSSNNAGIQIGNTDLASGEQTIVIGTNTNGGGTSNVIIGATGSSGSGTTKIQSKDETTIATDDVDRATFDKNGNLYLGNGASSNAPADFKIQGTASSATGVSGGDLTVQGGNATTGNADGGNLYLTGGSGTGSGSNGLVVINTPTYTNATVQNSASSTNVTQGNVDSFGVVTLNATADNVKFTLVPPSLGASAAGRIVYVTAANGSHEYQLRANVGGGAGVEQTVPMKQNTTATMIWSGSLWTVAGSAGSNLQSAYDNSAQTSSNPEITLQNNGSSDGLTVRDSATNPVNGALLEVKDSTNDSLFSVNKITNEFASNPGAEVQGASATTFPANTWEPISATVSRNASAEQYIATGSGSVKVVGSSALSGTSNRLTAALAPSTEYTVTASVRLESGTFTDFGIDYSADGAASSADCLANETIPVDSWHKISCTFTTPSSGVTAQNALFIGQTSAGAHTYYIDNLSLSKSGSPAAGAATSNVQVGSGTGNSPTLFTLDKNASAPTTAAGSAPLGSMYYDTTLGKVQCNEADGWGDCGSAPDVFVSMSPEYANAIVTGSGTGTMSTDLCSDDMNVNDGSSSQPTICGTHETYNFYKWTTANASSQFKVIYATYQLPSNFKSFVSGAMSLAGRTDSADSQVSYDIYKIKSDGSGTIRCTPSEQMVSTGVQSTWQKVVGSGSSDPANCSFGAGDRIMFKIPLGAKNSANAYVSNLDFAYSTK